MGDHLYLLLNWCSVASDRIIGLPPLHIYELNLCHTIYQLTSKKCNTAVIVKWVKTWDLNDEP